KATCDCCIATITRARSALGSPISNAFCIAPAWFCAPLTPSIALLSVSMNPGASLRPTSPGRWAPGLRSEGSIALAGAASRPIAPMRISWARIWLRMEEMSVMAGARSPGSAAGVQARRVPRRVTGFWLSIDAVFAELLDQGRAAQAEVGGGVGDHGVGFLQCLLDQLQLDVG